MLATMASRSSPAAMPYCSSVLLVMQPNSPSSSFLRTLVRGQLLLCFIEGLVWLIYVADIERFYGKRKAIARRTPIFPSALHNKSGSIDYPNGVASPGGSTPQANPYLSTPAVTEGDTATETELETEIEEDISPSTPKSGTSQNKPKPFRVSRHQPNLSMDSATSSFGDAEDSRFSTPRSNTPTSSQRRKVLSQHDLLNKYFRRDAVVLRNVDLFRWVSSSVA